MDFSELLEKRRSIRDYEDKEVPLELIEEILEESVKAPNGGNRQPWSFVIINNRECIKKVSDVSKRAILDDINKDPDNYMKQYKAGLKNEKFNVFYNAPALILILGQPDAASTREDCSLLACYLMLSAASKGLGTCWVALGGNIKDQQFREEIGIPDRHEIIAPIILGYPKNIPPMRERRAPEILKIIS
jgi:nitroreductase